MIMVTVDEELVFADEAAAGADSWCCSAREASVAANQRRVAYTNVVLRLRLPEGAGNDLLDALKLRLRPSPEFSKALTATALLRRDLALPLPPWMCSEPPTVSAASRTSTP